MEIKIHYHLLFFFFLRKIAIIYLKQNEMSSWKNTKGEPNLLEDPIEINCFLTEKMLFISCNQTQANQERKGKQPNKLWNIIRMGYNGLFLFYLWTMGYIVRTSF